MPNFSLSIEIISMLTDVLISHNAIIFKGDNSFIRPFIKRKMPKTKKKTEGNVYRTHRINKQHKL